jgi:hypothetical protein
MNDLQTPLHWAARIGDEKIVQLLIDRGAKINIQDVKSSSSFLAFFFSFFHSFNRFILLFIYFYFLHVCSL